MSKKIIAFALAAVFAFSMAGPVAQGATIEELNASIQAMFDEIAKLQLALTTATGGTTTTGLCISEGLKYGVTSDAVKTLQEGLKQDVSVYPEGLTTGYFGPLTKAAVIRFQEKYAVEVLAPWGLTKGTGYVGSTTTAKFNALYCIPVEVTPVSGLPEGCTSTEGFSPTTGLSCAGTTTTTVGPSYGSLSVTSYPVSNPQTTLYGGATYELIAGQYKATGSDMTIKKVSVEVVDVDTTTFPWQVFTTLSVWDGSTMLAELPITEANAIKNTFAHDYTFDISGLNLIVPNGTQKVLTVKGTVVTNAVSAVTSTVTPQTYTVTLLASGVVSSDTAGVTYTTVTGSNIAKASLAISASQAATITTTVASDNPVSGNVIVSDTATTKIDLLKFNVKSTGVASTFNSGTIKVTVDNSKLDSSDVTSLELWDGGTLVAAAAPSGWSGGAGTSTWSDFTLPISAGTTKTLTVKAVIAQQLSTFVGAGTATIVISIGPSLTGIDSNSNVITAAGTGVTGNTQYVFLVAPTFAMTANNFTVSGSSTTTHRNDLGDTSVTFSVTANGGDIFIPKLGNTTSSSGTLATIYKDGSVAGSAVAATGEITFEGTGTATGTATVTINTTDVTYSYTTSTASSTVASEIVLAIEANSTTTALVVATSTAGVVSLTAQTAGYAGNSITYLATTTDAGITVTPIASTEMTGGIDATSGSLAWTCSSPAIDATAAAEASSMWYKISEGASASCEATDHLTNTNATAGTFQVALTTIMWSPTVASSTTRVTQIWGLNTLKTGLKYLGI